MLAVVLWSAPSAQAQAPSPCSPGALCVGPGQRFQSLNNAIGLIQAGRVVEVIAGTYRESINIDKANVTIRGVGGRPHFDCAGRRPARDMACLLLSGDNVTLENLEISGAQIVEALGANAACVRNGPGMSFTLRAIVCHSSQNGVLTNGGAVVIEDSEFYDNSWTGFTHNIYLSGACPSAVVRRSIFRDARVAHEFKSRCTSTTIIDSTFLANRGSRALDLSDGGEVLIQGGVIRQSARVQNPEIIGYAPESCARGGAMMVRGTRIAVEHPAAAIRNFGKCGDAAITLEGVTYEGRKPNLVGRVIER
jgi:Right handed beta helix region